MMHFGLQRHSGIESVQGFVNVEKGGETSFLFHKQFKNQRNLSAINLT